MASKKEILQRIETLRKDRREIDLQISKLEDDYKRLLQPDVMPVGTRVRLKRNWATEENYKRMSGWRAYLHFMHPHNPATIVDVQCYDQKVSYYIKFDDQTCYYTFSDDTYISDGVFNYKQDELEYYSETKHILELKQGANYAIKF